MKSYPHTIENGAGELLTFSRCVPGVRGDRLEGENRVAPGSGPPMHVHHFQEEGLTVLSGRLGYQIIGDEPRFAAVGETVVFEPGCGHRFWADGSTELHCAAYIEPADNIEYFLGSLFESQAMNGGHRPSLLDVAYLATRYRSEFEMLAIPIAAQRLLFPILIAVGKLLGRYDKYADAPHPYSPARADLRSRP